jgi:hypothetical protein
MYVRGLAKFQAVEKEAKSIFLQNGWHAGRSAFDLAHGARNPRMVSK